MKLSEMTFVCIMSRSRVLKARLGFMKFSFSPAGSIVILVVGSEVDFRTDMNSRD